MNDRNQKLRIGMFITSGALLLLVMLFFFGMSDFFTHKITIKTYFSESVQGLTVGSGVKYRGVPIGTVSKIAIRVLDKLVEVDMEINPDNFVNPKSSSDHQQLVEFTTFFRNELAQGMRCRLEYTGITGMRYIDFDYFAQPGEPLPSAPAGVKKDTLYIPAVKSSFSDILKALNTSLDRISRIRFEEISTGLEHALTELAGLISDPAIKSTINRINEVAEHLERSSRTISQALDEKQINRIIALLEADLKNVGELTAQLVQETTDAGIPSCVASIRGAANSIVNSQDEFSNTLLKLNQALDSLRELADYLNQDPGSLIRGKKKPKIME